MPPGQVSNEEESDEAVFKIPKANFPIETREQLEEHVRE